MHIGAHFLQTLFVGNAEMLLLVDNQQPKVLERHRFAEQRMGANNDIDRAVFQPGLCLRQFFCSDKARCLADIDRKAAEAILEGCKMLAGEQRGWHHNRHLAT
jgi:hypothetical protein